MQLQRSLDLFYRDQASPLLLTKRYQVLRGLSLQAETTRQRQWDFNTVNGLAIVMLGDTLKQIFASPLNPQQYETDADRYTLGLVPQLEDRQLMYDPVLGRAPTVDWFFTNKKSRSIILPVGAEHVFETYPMDQDWSNYRPFRMVDNNTRTLCLNFAGAQLNYREGAPTLTTFTWDIAASALQYLALNKVSPISIETYVHRYLLLPALIDDNINLWLLGEYTAWIAGDNPVYADIDFGEVLTYRPTGIDQLKREVLELVGTFKHSSAAPQRLADGLPLLGGMEVSEWYQILRKQAVLEDGNNFEGVYFLRSRRFFLLALYLCGLNPRMPDSATYLRMVHRDVRYFKQMSPVSSIKDPVLKAKLARMLENFYMEVDYLFDML